MLGTVAARPLVLGDGRSAGGYATTTRPAAAGEAPLVNLPFWAVEERVGRRFDTLLLDCEGCIGHVLGEHEHGKRLLSQLRLLLLEQAGHPASYRLRAVTCRHVPSVPSRAERAVTGCHTPSHAATHGSRVAPLLEQDGGAEPYDAYWTARLEAHGFTRVWCVLSWYSNARHWMYHTAWQKGGLGGRPSCEAYVRRERPSEPLRCCPVDARTPNAPAARSRVIGRRHGAKIGE